MRVKSIPESSLGMLKQVLSQQPPLTYIAMLRRVEAEKIAYTDAFSKAFSCLGHTAIEVISNFRPLQEKWSLEQSGDVASDPENILISQIISYQPTILWFQNHICLRRENLNLVRNKCRELHSVVVHRAYPNPVDQLCGADLVLCGSPALLERYHAMGIPAALLYHAADQELCEQPDKIIAMRAVPAVFCGTLESNPNYADRVALLNCLADSNKVKVYLSRLKVDRAKTPSDLVILLQRCKHYFVRSILSMFPTFLLRVLFNYNLSTYSTRFWRRLNEEWEYRIGKSTGYPRYMWPPPISRVPLDQLIGAIDVEWVDESHLYGRRYYEYMKDAKIVVNSHSNASSGFSENLRMFEGPATGAALLTEASRNLKDLYVPDEEVITFASPLEARWKLEYFLKNIEMLQKVASAGKLRVKQSHTWTSRAPQALEIIWSRLS